MSSFDDWFDNKRPPIYTVHTDRLSQDRCIAEQSYNAGMERSAEILDELYNTYATNEAKDIAELQAHAIRKEIEK